MNNINTAHIQQQIQSVQHWYHQITMPDGSVTPGINASAETLRIYDRLGFPADFSGKRVLDVGCADGYFSFVAEKRGADEVIAIDYRLPTASGFSVVASILGSKVKHVVDNVYNLTPEKYGKFDVVIFVGVLYHLRNPLLALDRVREMANEGGTVIVESHIANPELIQAMHKLGVSVEIAQKVVGLPIWNFYYADSLNNDASNKWAPTLGGLINVCKEAQLEPLAHSEFGSRGAVVCRAQRHDLLESSRQMDISVGINVA